MSLIETELMIDRSTALCTCSDRCKIGDYVFRTMLYGDEAWHNMTYKRRIEALIEWMFNLAHDNTIVSWEGNEIDHGKYIYCLDCMQDQLIYHTMINPMDILDRMMSDRS